MSVKNNIILRMQLIFIVVDGCVKISQIDDIESFGLNREMILLKDMHINNFE